MLIKIRRLELIIDQKTGKVLAVLLLTAILGAACGGRPVGSEEEGEPGNKEQEQQLDIDSPPMCAVDFPCGPEETMHCINSTQYRAVRTMSCEEICGDVPCSGGACEELTEIKECPAGQGCVKTTDGGIWERNDHCALLK